MFRDPKPPRGSNSKKLGISELEIYVVIDNENWKFLEPFRPNRDYLGPPRGPAQGLISSQKLGRGTPLIMAKAWNLYLLKFFLNIS